MAVPIVAPTRGGEHQVEGAKISNVRGNGGALSSHIASILGTEAAS